MIVTRKVYENGELSATESYDDGVSTADFLAPYRDYKAEHYPYKGIILRLGYSKAMTSLSTLYLLCLANSDIPDSQVMADWQEDEGDIQITAGDLRADGADILNNYQKAWSAYKSVKDNTYDSQEAAVTAFEEALNA